MVFQNIKQCLPPLLRRQPIQAKSPAKENNPDGKTVQNETLAAHISHPEYPLTTMTVPVDIVIVGGGIVGLVLALALHHHGVCRHVQVFEQAPAFHEDVGAGMGLYPNGLRVIRDISPSLLKQLQEAGSPYQYRRWMRHDGTEVAVADETVLARKTSHGDKDGEHTDMDIQPIGIRRWKLQKILYDAAVEAGVVVHFGKRLDTIQESTGGIVHLQFDDGSTCDTKLLLAADGAKSRTRSIVTDGTCVLKYLGTTCLMGTSTTTPRENRGLMLPTSPTTKCHGAFYPTGETEQCFQFHFPTTRDNVSDAALGGWGGMTHTMSQEECHELAQQLEKEGWDEERFLQPLQNVDKALRVGLTTLDPPLQKFSFGHVVLVGDAAHPPVPYLGQGAQQGLEDAGTLALLLKQFCVVADGEDNGQFTLDRIEDALQAYNELRVPRSNDMVEHGKLAGKQQQKRAENQKYNLVREELIQREVFYNENSAHLFLGAHHDYKEAVGSFLKSYDSCLSKERKAISEPHLQTVPEEG